MFVNEKYKKLVYVRYFKERKNENDYYSISPNFEDRFAKHIRSMPNLNVGNPAIIRCGTEIGSIDKWFPGMAFFVSKGIFGPLVEYWLAGKMSVSEICAEVRKLLGNGNNINQTVDDPIVEKSLDNLPTHLTNICHIIGLSSESTISKIVESEKTSKPQDTKPEETVNCKSFADKLFEAGQLFEFYHLLETGSKIEAENLFKVNKLEAARQLFIEQPYEDGQSFKPNVNPLTSFVLWEIKNGAVDVLDALKGIAVLCRKHEQLYAYKQFCVAAQLCVAAKEAVTLLPSIKKGRDKTEKVLDEICNISYDDDTRLAIVNALDLTEQYSTRLETIANLMKGSNNVQGYCGISYSFIAVQLKPAKDVLDCIHNIYAFVSTKLTTGTTLIDPKMQELMSKLEQASVASVIVLRPIIHLIYYYVVKLALVNVPVALRVITVMKAKLKDCAIKYAEDLSHHQYDIVEIDKLKDVEVFGEMQKLLPQLFVKPQIQPPLPTTVPTLFVSQKEIGTTGSDFKLSK